MNSLKHGEVCLRERYAEDRDVCGCERCCPTPAVEDGALQSQGASVPTQTEEAAVIDHMVSRFLAWRLPENFNPDGGVRFDKERLHPSHWPTGTNLLDWRQAEAMVRHMMQGLER